MHNVSFTHLHVHTFFSLLDGESSPARLAKRAKELGMSALAITDHNHLLGVIDFKKACEEEAILPIFGCEMYYSDDISILSLGADKRRELAIEKAVAAGVTLPTGKGKKKPAKKEIDAVIAPYLYPTKQFHILFLAKNNTGYKNLVKLQSEASRLCTYNGRYLCDNTLIEKYKEGLIMTTACLGSRTAYFITHDEFEKAEALILEWKALFGEDFYLEIQPLLDNDQYKVNSFYMQMAQKHQIKLIATNDVHYTLETDIDDHDSMLCIGTNAFKDEEDRMRYQPEFWLRSEAEMQAAFTEQNTIYGNSSETYLNKCYEAMRNTKEIEGKIENNVNIGAEFSLFPQVKVQDGYTPERFLEKICWERLYKYLKQHPDYDVRTYEARLKEELDVINPKGFAPYMLVNQEMMNWCKSNLLPTGPGRGSAAGSLVLLLLGITKLVDPVKEKLLFSRFLTKDRTSLPDVDNDFSYKRRGEVIEHLQEEYGFNNIAHIGTITFLGVKSGLKDFARILRVDYNLVNNLTAKLDEIMDYASGYKFKDFDKLKDAGERYQQKYQEFVALEEANSELFRLARKYEGTPRNTGVHASGIVVMPVPVSDVFPTKTDEGVQVCLFTGTQLDAYGALN